MHKLYLLFKSYTSIRPDYVKPLPPLDCLRHFEAAARHQSFVRAAEEFHITPAAIAHRVRMLEKHLGAPLFSRRHRSVRLNLRGRSYFEAVQRILFDIHDTTALHADRRRFLQR